ncbi:MAG: acyltransferase [Pirellulales bacterium]
MTAVTHAPRPRFAMLEGIRGLGAVAIAAYHIFRYGPLPEAAASWTPEPIEFLVSHGWMAVQWFFVIAGFSLAFLLLDKRLQFRDVWLVARRRTLRLGVAYWFTIFLAAAITWIAIQGFNDRSFNEQLPTWDQVLAHVLFLKDIIDYENLTAGIWFLAIDVQFGVVFAFLLALAQRLSGNVDVTEQRPRSWALVFCFAPLALYSLFFSMSDPTTDMWFHHFFCMPVLGAAVCWTLEGRLNPWVLRIYFSLFVLQLVRDYSLEAANALTAGIVIYVAGCLQRLHRWLSHPLLQYLGRISYSLFLIHYPVSWLVQTMGTAVTGISPGVALLWLLASLLASIGAAHLLYTWVELPGLEWARRIH